ncbi:MAG: class I SAM-dependent methyltransferase [Ferruginibacter sp.]|nr:class I SAM-dependent methyltransferase [Ferruginibacter sp.]
MIRYSTCPVCSSTKIGFSNSINDYSVTQEQFEVWTCSDCSFVFTQNVPDASSIGKYYASADYISHTEIKTGLINRLYHYVRSYTLKRKRKLIQKEAGIYKGFVLDVGCGTGAFLSEMQNAGWKITGIEPDSKARENALKRYDIHSLPNESFFELHEESFDVITMWHVLEHVHKLHEYVSKLKRLLKPRGVLLIAVPNYTSYDAARYKHYWAAYDVPRHLYHFSPQSMRHLMNIHQLNIRRVKPMWFDSFYVSMLSEKYKRGNMFSAFFTGFISNCNALFNKQRCSSLIYIIEKQPT